MSNIARTDSASCSAWRLMSASEKAEATEAPLPSRWFSSQRTVRQTHFARGREAELVRDQGVGLLGVPRVRRSGQGGGVVVIARSRFDVRLNGFLPRVVTSCRTRQ